MAGPIPSPVDPPKITSPATRATDKRSIPKSPQLYKPRISISDFGLLFINT